jgi:hypothetical protein
MNGKLQESAYYLKCCTNLENETFKLYETLSKKINQPESSFILGFAYDSLKCAKTIQAILDYLDATKLEDMSSKKNFAELSSSISEFTKKISKTNNINYEMACEILKELDNLENQLIEAYTNYVQSSLIKTVSDEFSKLSINLANFKKVFETFIEQKQKHKETILEIIYSFETKEADRLRNATPLVKYTNPDSWIHESTIHTFSATPVAENTTP